MQQVSEDLLLPGTKGYAKDIAINKTEVGQR